MRDLIFKAFAGACAALLAWLIWEPQFPKMIISGGDPAWVNVEIRFILTLSAFIGLAIVGASGWQQGSKVHAIRGALAGLVLGAIGGTLGHQIGGKVSGIVFGPGIFDSPDDNPVRIVARVVAFVPIGAILGAALGAVGLSWRRVWVGVIGGAIGAGIGGAVFDIIGRVVGQTVQGIRGGTEVGSVSRAVTAVSMGFAIGLFTALMDRATRQAWVRLILGRNEGKEWPIDAQQTFLGRSESAGVPLFGDPNVMPMHAVIERRSGQYILVDGGSPIGTGLNGQRVMQPTVLTTGDMIQICSFNLQFSMKSGRAVRTPEQIGSGAMPIQPQPVPQTAGPVGSAATVAMTAPAGMMAPTQAMTGKPMSLVATTGPLAGQRFEVAGSIDVGRECPAIPMSFDSMVSRRHAQFSVSPAGLSVTDLGSTNGTLVNGQKVQTAALRPGDTVQIGSSQFRVEG